MKFKKKIFYIYFVSGLALLMMHSCMVGPKFNRPEMEAPESFLHDSNTDSLVNLKWWEIFQDETLQALIDSALVNNKDVLIAVKRIEESAYAVGYNRADLFPSFGYGGSASRGNIGQTGAALGETSNLFSGVGNVYWELDFWGKYRRATEAAKAELLASEYGLKSVQIGLISNVATLYFQLQDYKSRLEVSHKTFDLRQQSLFIIGERFDKGIVPELDLNQAQIQAAIAEANIPFYEELVARTEHALRVLLGQNPGNIATLPFDETNMPDSIPSGIPSDLLERRPDILYSEQLAKAQNSRIGVAQAMRFPSISLTGALGAASADLTNLLTSDAVVWSLAGNITGPIFNFGKNKRRVEIERARAEQYTLEYEKTVLNAFAEVENALIGIDASGRELEAYMKQQTAATNAAMLAWARYDLGVTSYLEVLETQRQLFETELRTLNAKSKLLEAYVRLYKALGGGWITEEEMAQAEAGNGAQP